MKPRNCARKTGVYDSSSKNANISGEVSGPGEIRETRTSFQPLQRFHRPCSTQLSQRMDRRSISIPAMARVIARTLPCHAPTNPPRPKDIHPLYLIQLLKQTSLGSERQSTLKSIHHISPPLHVHPGHHNPSHRAHHQAGSLLSAREILIPQVHQIMESIPQRLPPPRCP